MLMLRDRVITVGVGDNLWSNKTRSGHVSQNGLGLGLLRRKVGGRQRNRYGYV